MKKALVLFSGGLDSRVTAKFMEELGFEVHLCFVKLPFGAGCGSPLKENEKFAKEQGFHFHLVDATKEELFLEYLSLVKNPKHGLGVSVNPCRDCKIFIFKEGKKVAEKIKADIICTGEVLAQRPMSQMKHSLVFDEEKAGLKDKILRPLSAKILPETIYEKKGIIDREKLLGIHGRQRVIQMKLADKYNITYPNPAGGCLLCEKTYGAKLNCLLKEKPSPKIEEISLLNKGRLFKKEGFLVVGRYEKENDKLEKLANSLNWGIEKNLKIPGPTVIYEKTEDKDFAIKLWDAYTNNDLKKREEFESFKI
ncbi:hypothetical protein GW932_00705 [archaeon]|nr:hypothetical protein [archaeon]